MAAPTDRYGLARPDDGSDDWGGGYRAAMTTIDAALGSIVDSLAADVARPPVFIQPTQPTAPGPYVWIQTGLPGGGFGLWFHDGMP